jgi:hypothetical protein
LTACPFLSLIRARWNQLYVDYLLKQAEVVVNLVLFFGGAKGMVGKKMVDMVQAF